MKVKELMSDQVVTVGTEESAAVARACSHATMWLPAGV